jgi:Protein of unknown function (DUF4127)
MKRCLLAVPVDGRPAVRSQVQGLVACAGWQLMMPDVPALGHFREPADRDALRAWVMAQGDAVDGFVLSLDMLVYGGLVPSRFIEDDVASLAARLGLIAEIKTRWPDKPLYAFAATLRISNSNGADEEKPYWLQYGKLLWRWSYHQDRANAFEGDDGDSDDDADGRADVGEDSAAIAAATAKLIPKAIRDDYLATRARNFSITQQALAAAREGRIDRLVLPQDDTAAFGLNIAERRVLQAEVKAQKLSNKVLIYAGADEVMHTLCAHLIGRLQPRPALRLWLAPSDPQHINQLMALYEDRPLMESIRNQVQAVGATLVDDPEHATNPADMLLAVHTQGTAQGDWASGRPLPQRVGLSSAWLKQLGDWNAAGKPIALVDLAFANGGDPWLLAQPLPPLAIYAGWNTASNSLGSALAHAVLAQGHLHSAASKHACALRLLEDGLYQAVLRQTLRGCIDESRCTPAALQNLARELLLPWANAWAAQRGLGFEVSELHLPWGRSFEVDLRLVPSR